MRLPIVLLLIYASTLYAETGYRYVHPDGTVEYSDTPIQGGEEIKLQEAPTIKFEPVSPSATSEAGISHGKQSENVAEGAGITITYPQPNQTIWFDESGMSVSIAVSAPLEQGEVINVTLDGQLVASGTGNSYNIGTVYRGTHTLSARVVGADGTSRFGSAQITFHMRQHSLLEPKKTEPAAPTKPEPILP